MVYREGERERESKRERHCRSMAIGKKPGIARVREGECSERVNHVSCKDTIFECDPGSAKECLHV